jgi:hypothetical protein
MKISRLEIIAFNGEPFRADDLSARWSHSIIGRLEKLGEIECIGTETSEAFNRKQRKIYREVRIAVEGKKERKMADALSGWRNMWPEFFTDPKFEGQSRQHFGWNS